MNVTLPLRQLSLLICCLGLGGPAQALCPDLDVFGLKSLVATRKVTPVIFFASWCSECAAHLRQTLAPGTLLIATFDERHAAEAVVKQFAVTAPCYLDHGIAGVYRVKSVPMTLWLDHAGVPASLAPVQK